MAGKNDDKKSAYAQSGVDVEAGNQFVQSISGLVMLTKLEGVESNLGDKDFASVMRMGQELIAVCTDGVGTKLAIAQQLGVHDTVGIDLAAMCINDLLCVGAVPVMFLDYFATGKLEQNVGYNVVKGVSNACIESRAELSGGETAEMPGMYPDGVYDLAGFAVGHVKYPINPKQTIQEGDVLIGLASSGVHSNGFSLIRKLVKDNGLSYDDPAPFDSKEFLGDALLTPTKIYVKEVLAALETGHVKGLAHITGGGIVENIPRILPDGLCAEVYINDVMRGSPPVFKWLQELLPDESIYDLMSTFNMGVGMVLVVPRDKIGVVIPALNHVNAECKIIGQITKATDNGEPVTLVRT